MTLQLWIWAAYILWPIKNVLYFPNNCHKIYIFTLKHFSTHKTWITRPGNYKCETCFTLVISLKIMTKLTWMEKLHPAWSSASLIAESTESSFSTPLAFFLLLRFLELKIIKWLVLTLLFIYYTFICNNK